MKRSFYLLFLRGILSLAIESLREVIVMKIKEILELTQKDSLADIAKKHLTIGKGRARYALKEAGCYSRNGLKGWFYNGEDKDVLEKSIYEFLDKKEKNPIETAITIATKEVAVTVEEPRPNVTTKEPKNEGTKERINQPSNLPTKEQKKQSEEKVKQVALTLERTKEPTNERSNVVRKRSSFDIDVELMKELKIQAVLHDKNIYEIVETAIRQHLHELKKG